MSQTLADFVIALAVDPACAKRFEADPLAEVSRAGLNGTEIDAVLSGDSHKVRAAMGRNYADHMTQTSNPSATRRTRRKTKPTRKSTTKRSR